jgi:hypothetical protein
MATVDARELRTAAEHRGAARRRNLDSAYWVFFACYAAVSVLWLILSLASFFWPDLVPSSMAAHHSVDLAQHGEDLLLSLGTLALGLFLIWLAPDNVTARAFAVGLVGTAVGFSLTAHHLLEAIAPEAMTRLTLSLVPILHVIFHTIAGVAYAYALLLFPDGKLPPVSRVTLLAVWTLLVGILLVLLIEGREPSYFILYCGIAVVVAGWFSQWTKARASPDPIDRERSRTFHRALLLAVGIAVGLVGIEWLLRWHSIIGGSQAAGADRLTNIVFASVPPLLAGTGLVVFVGILQFRLWGVGRVHKPSLFRVLVVMVMGVFVVAEVVLEAVVQKLGTRVGASVTLTGVAAVLIGLAILDRPREFMKETVNRLVYGTPVRPHDLTAGFMSDLAVSVSADAVVPALARVLGGMHVTEGRLRVDLPSGGRREEGWPPGAAGGGEPIPLVADGRELGSISVVRQGEEVLSPAERKLLSDLGAAAALAIRARVDEPSPGRPDVARRPRRGPAEHVGLRHRRREPGERRNP